MASSPVVRVDATVQFPDHESPWQAGAPERSTGSGVLIATDRVLTGAHVVAHSTFVQVQKATEAEKAVCRVAAICHDCDLALLEILDKNFTEGVQPAAIGTLPRRQDRVAVAGYPIGGDEVSITEGVVSRLEVQPYAHSQRELLAATVDAAINEGTSGGPVFRDGRVVGIAFQKFEEAEAAGEMVPATLIQRFLQGVEEERPLTVPGLGIQFQTLENPSLRTHLNLDPQAGGVLVRAVDEGSSAWQQLESGDVLLSVDGFKVESNGTVRYRDELRTRFTVVLSDHFVDDPLPVTIWRQGRLEELELVLRPYSPLVPRSSFTAGPTYYIWGGIVFEPLSRDFLCTWDEWSDRAPKDLLALYHYGLRTPERREVVCVSQVLAAELNVGYEGLDYEIVTAVNGVAPVDMQDFVERVERVQGTVELRTQGGGLLVLDSEAARRANREVLEHYRIPADRSSNLPS